MASWTGKVAFVTGAGLGIGRATAVRFARIGANVVAVDVNDEAGRETIAEIGHGDSKAIFVQADVSSESDVAAAVEKAVSTFGRIDLLHNNAAIMRRHDSLEAWPIEEFRRVIDVNLNAPFLVAKAVAPVMRDGGGGVIINMSSQGGLVSVPYSPSYAAAKAGVISLTRTLPDMLRGTGIRVNAILPGFTDTPMTRNTRARSNLGTVAMAPMAAEDLARAVQYLAEREDLDRFLMVVARDGEGRIEYRQVQDPPAQTSIGMADDIGPQ